MREMFRSVAGVTAAIMGVAMLAEGQGRVRSGNVAAAVAATVVSIAWKPMPLPVPVSLAVGERIAVKNLQGNYFTLERVNSSTWGRWPLTVNCVSKYPLSFCPGFKNSSGACCSCTVGTPRHDFPAGSDVRALLDMSPGGTESEIFRLEEIGTLVAPASSSPGLLQATLYKGQSLSLTNNRMLTLVEKYGWGVVQDYVLMTGGQEIGRWQAGLARLLTDESHRLALLTSLGRYRSDNWGIPKASLK